MINIIPQREIPVHAHDPLYEAHGTGDRVSAAVRVTHYTRPRY